MTQTRDRHSGGLAGIPRPADRRATKPARRALPAARQVQRRTHLGPASRRRRTRRPHQCRRLRADGRDRGLRPDSRREVRDLLRPAHPRGDARRTADDGLGAPARSQQGQQDGSRPQGTRSRRSAARRGPRNWPTSSASRSSNSTTISARRPPSTSCRLNKKWYETDSYKDVREIDILEDKKAEDPTGRLQNRDLMKLVTRGLNRNERLIVILYYYEEMTMKEIGATLEPQRDRASARCTPASSPGCKPTSASARASSTTDSVTTQCHSRPGLAGRVAFTPRGRPCSHRELDGTGMPGTALRDRLRQWSAC